MRILGIETSSLYGSVAAAQGTKLLREHSLAGDRRTAQSLAPAIARLLAEVGWKPSEVELVAVASGPGSFTGLRIGVTTAKTFAYAAGSKLIGVNTLAALAAALPPEVEPGEAIMPLIDAHRNQLFAARYRREGHSRVAAESGVEILDIDTWLAGAEPQAWLTGPVLPKLATEIKQRWPQVRLCAEPFWTPSAAAVAHIAQEKAAAGEFDDLFALVPQYYRPSYAEEKRNSKSKASN